MSLAKTVNDIIRNRYHSRYNIRFMVKKKGIHHPLQNGEQQHKSNIIPGINNLKEENLPPVARATREEPAPR
jgi:hypothetical protein